MSGDARVVLLSGGMDSVTLLHHVRTECPRESCLALSFMYGQKHSRELEMARLQAEVVGVREHRVVDVSIVGSLTQGGSALTDKDIEVPELSSLDAHQLKQPPTYVPNRNMILLSLAAAWAESVGATRVFYGAQAQDRYGYWDCTVDFIERINHVLSLNRGTPIQVVAPFVTMSKADILRRGIELGVDYSRTWTCYRGEGTPCGRCPTCVERARAFECVGVIDPLTGVEKR